MDAISRLARFREREGIALETISTLCGIAPRTLDFIEHGGYADVADEMALRLLFGDRFSKSELLATTIEPDETQRLDALKVAYQRTLAAWFGK